MAVFSKYWEFTVKSLFSTANEPAFLSNILAKTLGESKLGRQSQSMEPRLETNAAV